MADIKNVRQELDAWRGQRASKTEPVPSTLRKRIVHLLKNHTWTQIGNGLQISTSLLSRWMVELGLEHYKRTAKPKYTKAKPKTPANSTLTTKNSPMTFVEVVVPAQPKEVLGEIFVEFEGPSQATLRIRGALDPQSLRVLAEVAVQGGKA